MHAPRRRESARAHRCLQRLVTLRRSSLRPHHNRHQPVNPPSSIPFIYIYKTLLLRSEVVGRPLAALLANDGARVFSVDIDSIQEYTKRPASAEAGARAYHTHHVVRPASPELDLARCLAISDVVVSAVPSATYKVPTAALKDGCVCVNVAADKNFEADVRDKVRVCGRNYEKPRSLIVAWTGFVIHSCCGEGDDSDVAAESVSKGDPFAARL
jgi:hypothetical protein